MTNYVAETSSNQPTASPRHRLWVRVTHWLIAISVLGLVVSGIAILVAHPRLYWGETGAHGMESLVDLPIPEIMGPSVEYRLYHFFFAWVMVLAAFAYVVGGLSTTHFRRNLLPGKGELRWGNIASVIGAHVLGKRTSTDEAWTYNVVQRLTYLVVVFVLFPGVVLTGLGMSFGITSVIPSLATAFGGHQSMRTLHFVFSSLLTIFLIVHLAMLFVVGFSSHVRAMITGRTPLQPKPVTGNAVTRRKLVSTGIVGAAGVAGLGAAIHVAGRNNLIPPSRGNLLAVSETLTYATQRLLMAGQPLAREFDRSEISEVSPVNGIAPVDESYLRMAANGFEDWRLSVEGAVAHPRSFSLNELKSLPSESRIVLHACEEGWSFVAEWTGVRLSTVLDAVGTSPEARFVRFIPFANPSPSRGTPRVFDDSIDMVDALHPQTLLAYGMNGEDLPLDHGAPLRLRLSRHLGFKNIKYLLRLIVTENSDFYVPGRGTWYGGI